MKINLSPRALEVPEGPASAFHAGAGLEGARSG